MGELLGDGSASAGLSAVFCHLHPGSGGDGWTRLSAPDWPVAVRGRRLRWHSRAVRGGHTATAVRYRGAAPATGTGSLPGRGVHRGASTIHKLLNAARVSHVGEQVQGSKVPSFHYF